MDAILLYCDEHELEPEDMGSASPSLNTPAPAETPAPGPVVPEPPSRSSSEDSVM